MEKVSKHIELLSHILRNIKSMKVLVIAPFPPPITGHSIAARVFYNELIKYHEVEKVNLGKHSSHQGRLTFRRIIEVVKILKKIWLRKNEADVIYLTISESVTGNIKDVVIYLLCFKHLHRMIIHLHGGSIRELLFEKNRFIFSINKYFLRRLGGLIVLGQSHLSIFSDIVENKRIHVVPNFAEDYIFIEEDKFRAKYKDIRPLRVLFLSNLINGKGYNELVDAYLSMNDDLKGKVEIDFAGGFESDKQKNKFLTRISINIGIRHHGMVSGDKKRDLLTRSHILCLPTCLNEGQPISILEAYASGCVVITTDQGGISDIFKDGTNGYEVQKKSADSIKKAIEDIIKKPEKLLPIAIENREAARIKYRTSVYNASLIKVIEGIRFIS